MVVKYNNLRKDIQKLTELQKIKLLAIWMLKSRPRYKQLENLLARLDEIFDDVFIEHLCNQHSPNAEQLANQNILSLFFYKKPNMELKQAYITTIRDLKIARNNQTWMEWYKSTFFSIGLDYDAEINKYETLLSELE